MNVIHIRDLINELKEDLGMPQMTDEATAIYMQLLRLFAGEGGGPRWGGPTDVVEMARRDQGLIMVLAADGRVRVNIEVTEISE